MNPLLLEVGGEPGKVSMHAYIIIICINWGNSMHNTLHV